MWTGWLSTAWIDRPLKNTVFLPFRAGTSVEAITTPGPPMERAAPVIFLYPQSPAADRRAASAAKCGKIR